MADDPPAAPDKRYAVTLNLSRSHATGWRVCTARPHRRGRDRRMFLRQGFVIFRESQRFRPLGSAEQTPRPNSTNVHSVLRLNYEIPKGLISLPRRASQNLPFMERYVLTATRYRQEVKSEPECATHETTIDGSERFSRRHIGRSGFDVRYRYAAQKWEEPIPDLRSRQRQPRHSNRRSGKEMTPSREGFGYSNLEIRSCL